MYKVFLFNKALLFVSPEEFAAFEEPVPHFRFSDQADLLHRYRRLVQNGNEHEMLCVVAEDPYKVWKLFASGFRNVEAAGGVVMDPYGLALFIYRHNRWDLPKGKIEEGERTAEAAEREVEEECGIEVDHVEEHLTDSYHLYQDRGIEFLKKTSWYLMRVDNPRTPEPQTEEGISMVEWRSLDDWENMKGNSFASIVEVMEVAASREFQ